MRYIVYDDHRTGIGNRESIVVIRTFTIKITILDTKTDSY